MLRCNNTIIKIPFIYNVMLGQDSASTGAYHSAQQQLKLSIKWALHHLDKIAKWTQSWPSKPQYLGLQNVVKQPDASPLFPLSILVWIKTLEATCSRRHVLLAFSTGALLIWVYHCKACDTCSSDPRTPSLDCWLPYARTTCLFSDLPIQNQTGCLDLCAMMTASVWVHTKAWSQLW